VLWQGLSDVPAQSRRRQHPHSSPGALLDVVLRLRSLNISLFQRSESKDQVRPRTGHEGPEGE
jgi:hypothetical protein